MTRLALALALLTAAGAAWAGETDNQPLLTRPYGSLPPLTSIQAVDETGRSILNIDAKNRTITVPDDVNVNDTARRVFDVIVREYLPQCRDAPWVKDGKR